MVSGGQVMIKVEGQQALKANIDKAVKEIASAGDKAMQAVGLEIIAEAKTNLNANKTNNTGMLRASGKVQKAEDGTVDAGFFSSEQQNGYAEFVEFGRGPSKKKGAIPLEDSLKAWVHRKLGIAYGKELDSATFLIARKIHRKGTKPQPFFAPAVKKIEDKFEEIISNYIKKESKNV
jgi:HK97 gp10 family phage protein